MAKKRTVRLLNLALVLVLLASSICSYFVSNPNGSFSSMVTDGGNFALSLYHRNAKIEFIKEDGTALVVEGKDIDLQPSLSNSSGAFEVTFSFSETALKEQLQALNRDAVLPNDAYFQKQARDFVLVPETYGTLVDIDKLCAAASGDIASNNRSINIQDKDAYVLPAVTSQSQTIVQLATRLEHLRKLKITCSFPGGDQELDYGSTIFQWIDVVDNKLVVDKQAVFAFLQSSEETHGLVDGFVTADDQVVAMRGIATQSYFDKEDFLMQLETILQNSTKTTETIQPICQKEVTPTGRNTRDTYVEISIKQQHMWVYKDGELLLDTDIVTGADDGEYNTPTGVFRVLNKERNRYLQGYNKDGTKYKSWVSYWMPINNSGIGIHDATWQPNFGGSLYQQGYGSHGCINTPLENMEIIFSNIDVGTPVVVY